LSSHFYNIYFEVLIFVARALVFFVKMSKNKITSYFETSAPKKCRTSNTDNDDAKNIMIEMQTQMSDRQMPTSSIE
jgi:hypothetical protein